MKKRSYSLNLTLPIRYYIIICVLSLRTEGEEVLSVIFAGDISFDGPPRYFTHHHYHTYNDTLEKVAPIIRQADIAVGNLESPLVPLKNQLKDRFTGAKRIFLTAEPKSASALRFAGFDIMSLANNHMNDYGEEPINLTVNRLKKLGIRSFGINYGLYNAPQEPLIVEKRGIKLGFLGYCDVFFLNISHQVAGCFDQRQYYKSGPAVYSNQSASRDVKLLKNKVDVILVYIHWGREYHQTPNLRQMQIARYLHSLGVQVVIGAHQHVLQGHIYSRKGDIKLRPQSAKSKRLIIHRQTKNDFTAYGIGNFLFGQHGTSFHMFYAMNRGNVVTSNMIATYHKENKILRGPTMSSRIYKLKVSKRGVVGAQYLPVEILFNTANECLQPTPKKDAHWIGVCSPDDKACLH